MEYTNCEKIHQVGCDDSQMAGAGVGTIFVNHQLLIQRFTPAATKGTNLSQSDLSRPVAEVTQPEFLPHELEALTEQLLAEGVRQG